MPDKNKIPISELRAVIVGPHATNRDERSKLFNFLIKYGARKTALIGHPAPGAIAQRSIFMASEQGICRLFVLPRWKQVRYLSYTANLIITVCSLIVKRSKYDVYFGFGISYTPLGLLLRRLGVVKRVVFWTTDYFPSGVGGNRLIRWIYDNLHKACVESSDYIWDISPAIKEARQKKGFRIREEKVAIVPYMISRDQIEALPVEQVAKYSVILAGGASDSEFGLILKALAIVTDAIPQVKLSLTNYMPISQLWKAKIDHQGLQNNIDILGYIEDEAEVWRIVQRHRVGVAIYEPGSYKAYGDPAKIKAYIAQGVPVVMTRGPLIGEDIARHEAGIVVDYNENEVAQAILRLLTDDRFYRECCENAIKLASKYETEMVFREALLRTNILV